MSLGLKYWYKSQLNSLYIDVTNYVTEQVRGSNSINEMPSNFEFTLSVPKNGSDYLDIVSGDEIAITFDETCTSLLIHGNIIDSGIDIISFDRLRNKPFYKYNIICSQKDFSNTIIDTLDDTDTNLSVILDELMNYSDESIGSPYLSKYAVNFADYQISSFSVEKKTVREALTDLCQQIDCFWKLSYIVSPDNVNVLFVNRYIEISNKSGIMPTSSSIWQNGITTDIVKNGVITNPIVGNTSILANIVAETELKIKQDTSVICNSVELIGKIFTNNDSNSLYRYDFRAEPSKFEYILNGYASDIVYVAFQLKDPKDPVRIMAGSTTTVIKIPSRYAVGIEVGNKAYFQDDDTINFYPIDTVTKIDIYYTEIGFSTPLPFTIVEGHSFEIASNVTIYEEKYNLNYSQKGVVKYVNKDTEARIKFLDLSEPPPGVFVTVFYKKIQDYKIKFQNDVSKNLFGLKYKEIKLDDDIVLTQLEMDNLSSNLLVLEPKLTFSVNSKRYGLAPVGMNIPVIVNGFLNQNFILQNNSWEYLGKDPQKQHVFNQDLDFSNIINDPENYIKSLKKRKATKTTQLNTKNIMKELLNITENISYTIEIITYTGAFPSSIIGAWGTKTIDYSYVFNPISGTGDYTNYGSSGGTTPYLDRRNSGDNYPSWVLEGDKWGLDFSNSPYSGLRIPANNFPSSNQKLTFIVECRITQTTPPSFYIFSNIDNTGGINGMSLSTDTPMNVYANGRNNNLGEGSHSTTSSPMIEQTNAMFTISVDFNLNTAVAVRNQTGFSTSNTADTITTNINPTIDAFIGTNWVYETFGGTDTKLIIKKFAIIYDTFTDAQIKEIHRLMGF